MHAHRLTPAQERFAVLMLIENSAAEAYRRAYGLDPATPRQILANSAWRLRKHPRVTARIEELIERRAEALLMRVPE